MSLGQMAAHATAVIEDGVFQAGIYLALFVLILFAWNVYRSLKGTRTCWYLTFVLGFAAVMCLGASEFRPDFSAIRQPRF